MAVVLKGEQQNDGSFVFQASSEQVNGLNKMCDGNLNTQLSEVQFGMKMIQDDVDLSDISATFSFPHISVVRSFDQATGIITYGQLTNKVYTISHRNFNSLTELFDVVCQQFTRNMSDILWFDDGYALFKEYLEYDKELIKQNILKMTMNYRCSFCRSSTYTIDQLNQLEMRIYSNNTIQNNYAYIESPQLMKILNFQNYLEDYREQVEDGHIQISDTSIRFLFQYHQDGRVFANNCLFFSFVNTSNDTRYYTKNRPKTGLVTYDVNDTTYQYRTNQFPPPPPPKYLYFDCPQLSTQNIVLPDGRVLNVIAKTICTVRENQNFIMSTTEPLRELTIQNVVNTKFVIRIYNESFQQKRNYTKAVMILKSTMPKSKQVVNYYQGRPKLSVNIMNITEQQ